MIAECEIGFLISFYFIFLLHLHSVPRPGLLLKQNLRETQYAWMRAWMYLYQMVQFGIGITEEGETKRPQAAEPKPSPNDECDVRGNRKNNKGIIFIRVSFISSNLDDCPIEYNVIGMNEILGLKSHSIMITLFWRL